MAISLSFDTAELAEEYERISAERQFRGGQLLIRELELAPGEKLLDVGCGTGLLAEYAAGVVGPEGAVVGVDPLPLRVELARKKTLANLSFKVANAYDLSEFPAAAFDAVCMSAVFHWLPEKLAPLHQVWRVLKSGGRFGLTTGSRRNPNPLHVIRALVLARDPYNRYPAASVSQAYRVNADELEALLKQAGFEVKKIQERSYADRRSGGQRPTAEAAIRFSEASSFGNFLGHLPEHLRASARDEIKRELEQRVSARDEIKRELEQPGSPDAVRRERARGSWIVAIAVKP